MASTEGLEAEILGPLERRVMSQLWAGGPQTVGQVLAALNAKTERKLAYTTVMTILARLHEKGYVSRAKELRHYRYAAAYDERTLRATMGRQELGRLIDRYGAASLAGFAEELAGADSDLVSRLRELSGKRRKERE